MRGTVKDHDDSLITAARHLRKRIEQLPGSAHEIELDAHLCQVLAGVEDLADRVTLIEQSQRRLNERLEFLGHIARLLGHEDWTVPDPDPGALVTEAQACAIGASGAGEIVPQVSPASVHPLPVHP